MRKTWFMASLAAFALAGAFTAGAGDKKVTVDGTLVDSRCYLQDNKLTGTDHGDVKNCAAACLKTGNPAGLVTKDNRFYVLVVPSVALAEYAGMEVRVTGTLGGDQLINTEKVDILMHGKWWHLKLPNKGK